VQTLLDKLFNSMIDKNIFHRSLKKNIHETISEKFIKVSKNNFSHKICPFLYVFKYQFKDFV